jgi:NAD(P)H dehydrogenase (quinone)
MEKRMKFSVLYHSESGNSKKIADVISETASSVPGVESKAIDIESLDKSFIDASRVVVFGCPTYCGTMSWQLKRYLDTTDNKLAGKLGGAFATENHIGGGADFAELTIIGCLLVRGMIAYSGGAAEVPYTHFGAVAIKAGDESQVERAKKFALKMAHMAKRLFAE